MAEKEERPTGPEGELGRRYREVELPADFPVVGFRHSPWTDPLTRISALDVLELGICREGRGVFMVEGRLHPYRAGDCVVVRRNDWRVARSDRHDPSTWFFIQLEPSRLVADPGYRHDLLNGDLLGGVDFPNVVAPRQHPGICAVIGELARELERPGSDHREVVRGLVAALMPMLQRLPGREQSRDRGADDALPRIAPALELITARFDQELSVEDLADRCDLSSGHFRRLFQAALGEAPKQYLIRYRIHNAACMLEHRRIKITEIALASGFQTLSSFNRHFRSILGCAPREWRKRASSG